MHPKVLLSLSLILWAVLSYAQNSYQPGYYISNNQDTVYGQIDNRGDLRNGRICSFRSGEDGETMQYSPDQIESYRFEDGKFYISREIENVDEREWVFLEYLVNGISSLYYRRGEKADHYYIETREGDLIELTNDDIVFEQDGKTYSRKSGLFIGQLKSTFSDAPEIQKELDYAKFNHNSLIQLTSEYHDYVCDGEVCIIYEKKPPAIRIGVGPVIGFGTSGLKFVYFPSYDEYTYRRSMDLLLGLKVLITMPRLNEKLSFIVQAEYNESYFYGYKEITIYPGSATYKDLHVHLSTMKGLFGMQYKYPRGKIRPTTSLGLLLSFNTASDFKHVDEQLSQDIVLTRVYHADPLIKENYGVFISLGADWNLIGNQHLGLDLRYHYSKETIGTIVRRDGLSLTCGYYF